MPTFRGEGEDEGSNVIVSELGGVIKSQQVGAGIKGGASKKSNIATSGEEQ